MTDIRIGEASLELGDELLYVSPGTGQHSGGLTVKVPNGERFAINLKLHTVNWIETTYPLSVNSFISAHWTYDDYCDHIHFYLRYGPGDDDYMEICTIPGLDPDERDHDKIREAVDAEKNRQWEAAKAKAEADA